MRKLLFLGSLGLLAGAGCAPSRVDQVDAEAESTLLRVPDRGSLENASRDSDCDGLSDEEEFARGTDPARKDSDLDGIPDGVETGTARDIEPRCPAVPLTIATRSGSNPSLRDTDLDGIPDGVEDSNRNGIQDPGETDPRNPDSDDDGVKDAEEIRRGSNPLAAWSRPEIPEPMAFDLVRPLGARRGEFEFNTLKLWSWRGGFELAPEIEYAFADNHAVELEVPIHREVPVAVKVAYQPTLGTFAANKGVHGLQFISQGGFQGRPSQGTALYLLGYRWSPSFSALFMGGTQKSVGGEHECSSGCALLNGSLFAEPSRRLQLGLETNLRAGSEGARWMVMPQLRVHASKNFNLQAGLGAERSPSQQPALLGGLRLVVEL
jgi:hypothetical protein